MDASFLLTIEVFLLMVHFVLLTVGGPYAETTKPNFRTGATVSKKDQADFPPQAKKTNQIST